MKKLEITSEGCAMTVIADYIEINGTALEKLIRKHLPKDLEDGKKYPVKLRLSIGFTADEPIAIRTENY